MTVRFKQPFDYREGRTVTAYKAGYEGAVPGAHEAAARAAGALEEGKGDEGPDDGRKTRRTLKIAV